jgi:hypothetical protein
MYAGEDYPTISSTESRRFTLDFVNDLDPAVPEQIDSATWTIECPSDLNPTTTDPNPSSRLVGPPTILGTKVIQVAGPLLGGVIYRMRCVIMTTESAQPELYTHIRCVDPD